MSLDVHVFGELVDPWADFEYYQSTDPGLRIAGVANGLLFTYLPSSALNVYGQAHTSGVGAATAAANARSGVVQMCNLEGALHTSDGPFPSDPFAALARAWTLVTLGDMP
jgi:hypothetical protein